MDPEGYLIFKYAAIVGAISLGATRRVVVCAGTGWPEKNIGTYVSYTHGDPCIAEIDPSPIFAASSVECKNQYCSWIIWMWPEREG